MASFVIVFLRHWKLYTTILGVGTGTAIFGNFTILFAAMILVGVSLVSSVVQGGGKRGKLEKPIESYTRNELVAGFQYANVKLAENEKEIARLNRQVKDLSNIDREENSRDNVLRSVAAVLVAYDKHRNEFTAGQALELLRAHLGEIIE